VWFYLSESLGDHLRRWCFGQERDVTSQGDRKEEFKEQSVNVSHRKERDDLMIRLQGHVLLCINYVGHQAPFRDHYPFGESRSPRSIGDDATILPVPLIESQCLNRSDIFLVIGKGIGQFGGCIGITGSVNGKIIKNDHRFHAGDLLQVDFVEQRFLDEYDFRLRMAQDVVGVGHTKVGKNGNDNCPRR